jgi:hypothetical protein
VPFFIVANIDASRTLICRDRSIDFQSEIERAPETTGLTFAITGPRRRGAL